MVKEVAPLDALYICILWLTTFLFDQVSPVEFSVQHAIHCLVFVRSFCCIQLDSLEKKEQLKDQEIVKLEYELQLAKQQKEKIVQDKYELKSKLRNITEIWEEADEATINMLVEQLCIGELYCGFEYG